jgi:CRISPR-associated protein Cas1
MPDRIVDIAETAARLHVRYSQLVIGLADGSEVTTPLAELAALVISNPAVTMTQAVIAGVAENGGAVVICDHQHAPAAMMLPLQMHTTQTERLAKQAQASAPTRKRLWQQIVKAKIRAQGRLLRDLHGSDGGLLAMAERVRSGDSGHMEAQASRRYWPLLFGDGKFRRGSQGPDQNNHLNYGYAVLRALVTRAVCGAGLHPSMGLQHHNRYDTFSLASDVMEPFRPVIDRAVYEWVQEHDATEPLDKTAKAHLIGAVQRRFEWRGESRTLFDLAAQTASGIARVFMGDGKEVEIPEV